ncbi:antitoxin [Streptomyces pluripotens]|uniref:Antitoxin n=1 Tax=Streptomyces pluripotens TaxID=1355015 RepID=A0A221NT41_9ACTN|nr:MULTISPECIES: antitoxin [Streptomyces]ARP68850.1 kanamycin biosynthetic protein [Streptomyces pluripotens]ASN23104.1 antitoxin [Streptomyces pluripotens]KIE25231.1 kanamycin biosynthetic protein [Streptomyces sp. MUSC 125]MCH0556831.1 antitoxin [Streptomyces sp. MUM 16J]
MSLMDKIKGMLKGHEEMVDKGIDAVGDSTDRRTGNAYQSQVDTAQDRLRDAFGTRREQPPQS